MVTKPTELLMDRHSFGRAELLGVALALIGGFVGIFLGTVTGRLQLLSVFGGVSVALVIGLRSRVDGTSVQVLDQLNRMEHSFLPMLQTLGQIPELSQDIGRIVEQAAVANRERGSFIYDRVVEEVKADERRVTQIAKGLFLCANRNEELALIDKALGSSRSFVLAVASLGIEEWSKVGWDEYFARYLRHARANTDVKHTRVFIIPASDLQNPLMISLLERHRAAGIHTVAVDREKLRPDLCNAAVVFDDDLLLLHVNRQAGTGTIEVSFTDEADRIEEAKGHVRSLLDLAEDPSRSHILWP